MHHEDSRFKFIHVNGNRKSLTLAVHKFYNMLLFFVVDSIPDKLFVFLASIFTYKLQNTCPFMIHMFNSTAFSFMLISSSFDCVFYLEFRIKVNKKNSYLRQISLLEVCLMHLKFILFARY